MALLPMAAHHPQRLGRAVEQEHQLAALFPLSNPVQVAVAGLGQSAAAAAAVVVLREN